MYPNIDFYFCPPFVNYLNVLIVSMCFAAGACVCDAFVWQKNSARSASATPDVCGEPEGLEALCSSGRRAEAQTGRPLPGYAGWVLPAPRQTSAAAFPPRCRNSGPGSSCNDIEVCICLRSLQQCVCQRPQPNSPQCLWIYRLNSIKRDSFDFLWIVNLSQRIHFLKVMWKQEAENPSGAAASSNGSLQSALPSENVLKN